MISETDFIRLAYTPDLSEGGIAYATRTLTHHFDRSEGSLYARLRRSAAGAAVELAFRRVLAERGIPFEVKGSQPFSEPDRYEVTLGGLQCNLITSMITNRRQISAMRKNPAMLLSSPAMIPEEALSNASQTGKEVFIFAFLSGLVINSLEGVQKVIAPGQRMYLLHPFPADWSTPLKWESPGRLTLKSECATPVHIELGGQDVDRNFITERFDLPGRTPAIVQNNFYSLAYMHLESVPTARLGIHAAKKRETHIAYSHEWGNIWIYGLDIWLAGYLAVGEFHRKASASYAGSRVFQYSQTQTKELSIPLTDLRPLGELFEQVKIWSTGKRLR